MPRSSTLFLPLLLLTVATSAAAQDAKTVVADAIRAMGMTDLQSITFSGTASYGNFGQSRTLSFGLGSTTIRNYTRTIDFVRGISRASGDAVPPGAPNGVPPGPFEDVITPASPGIRQLEIWTTPWGFLKGASMGPVSVKTTKITPPGAAEPDPTTYRAVTWVPPFKSPSGQPYRIIGYIGPANLVDRVETWIDHPIMGDLEVMYTYTSYSEADGLKVPVKTSQKNIGMEVYVATLTRAAANPPDVAELLRPAAGGAPPAPVVAPIVSETLADGVYRLTGGGYDAVAVGLKDFAVIVGGGGSEARGHALVAETRRLFPGTPIRYAVNLHGHFDHSIVLPAFASQGITIVTDDQNRYFLFESLSIPRILVGDAFAKSKKKPKVEGVPEKLVLRDAAHSLELHHLKRIPHADGMLAAWLPKEKILFVSDIELPAPGAAASPSLVALLENADRLGLDFDTLISNGPRAIAPIARAELLARIQKAK